TTGVPKGVAVSHRQVLPVLSWFVRYFALDDDTRVLQTLSPCFDFGVFELLTTLVAGGSLYFLPAAEQGELTRSLDAIEQHDLNTVHTTPAFFRELTALAASSGRRLTGVEIVHLGGEAVDRDLVREIEGIVDPRCRLYNGYGPTETSINSTVFRMQGRPLDRDVRATVVPIGQATASSSVHVLDRGGLAVPAAVPGELLIGGPGVARGYLNRPALTAERFVPDPFADHPGRRLYRSGDLVRWLPEGQIEFLGRIDHQVKIRGLRIELGEIEAALAAHPAVRQAVVLARERETTAEAGAGERWLVAYAVRREEAAEADAGALRAWLAESLPAYMVPSAVVWLDALPLTATGKVNRRALPAPEWTGPEDTFVAPRDPTEELLAGIWAEVLGAEGTASRRVGATDNFFELGGHSLLATQVVSRIRETFRVELPVQRLFEAPTVAELADVVRGLRCEERGPAAPAMVPVSRDQELPLSFAQQRLWFLDQFEPGSPAYNLPAAVRLGGAVVPALLEQIFNEVVRRHEALRTTFTVTAGRPHQVIAEQLDLPLPVVELGRLPAAARAAEARRLAEEEALCPFDLSAGPLIRCTLLRLQEEDHAVLVTMHHIVSDGWSVGVFLRELTALHEAFSRGRPSPLAELPLQYADFAYWQRQWLEGEVLEAELAFWKQVLGGAPQRLELPTDRPRPAIQTFRGRTRPVALSRDLVASLEALSRHQGATLYMTLLATFQLLLSRTTGQEDVAVGSPIAGRNRREIEGMIGFFVNTLVLRTRLRYDGNFREQVAEVRRVTLDAYAHQDLPFERLVEELQPQRDLSSTPLFQVMFILQNAPVAGVEMPGLAPDALAAGATTAKFDLTLSLREGEAGASGELEYGTDLFDLTTMVRLVAHFERLLAGIVADPERRLAELPWMTAPERHQLQVEWPGTGAEAPADLCIQELFEAQVEARPDARAVVCGPTIVSYRELDERASRLAHHLREFGVGRGAGPPEIVVGIAAERRPEVVVGLLGILKAGGVYLPLDPSHPEERLAFQLRDAGARVLLVCESAAERLPEHEARVVVLDGPQAAVAGKRVELVAGPDQLAYVIYTSGTTGVPKGVAVSHRQVLPVLGWFLRYFGLDGDTRVLQNLSPCFDFGVFELLTTLVAGGTLCFLPEAEQGDLSRHLEAIEEQALNTVHTTPSLFRELTALAARRGRRLPGLEIVHLGGEAISRDLVREIAGIVDERCRLYNGYGPTETSINSTIFRIEGRPPDRGVRATGAPIGRATAQNRVYVLDRRGDPVPSGVAGELVIGGSGVARGYLNRPALTAERFVPDRFAGLPDPFVGLTGRRLYRSGDLVRWLPEGQIEFLGRVDHQVKIRGLRIELGEIEAALAAHPAVRHAVVLARDRDAGRGERWLVAYAVLREGATADAGALRQGLGERLPAYMVPSAIVLLDALPRTATGKVDRRALPAPESVEAEAGFAAPGDPTEEILAGIWAAVLGRGRVGVHDNFFDVGGHSLLATQVLSRIRETFRVELPVQRLFEAPTVAELADIVRSLRREDQDLAAPAMVPVSRDQELPLSFAQQRLWFLDQFEPGSPAYNLPAAVRLGGAVAPALLERIFNGVVRRHEALRTTFTATAGQPHQVIAAELDLPLPVVELARLPAAAREAEARRLAEAEALCPFDLTVGPLIRCTLLRLREEDHVVLVTMHHIVSDGWSVGIFLRELTLLHEAFSEGRPSPLTELPLQYADFAHWQRQWLQGEVLEAELAFWKQRLGDAPQRLELPTDRPRPAIQTFRGQTRPVALSRELSSSLEALSRRQGATLYMTLLATFQLLLSRTTGQEDIAVGSPIAGRNRREIEGMIGFFVNTLVLRTRLRYDGSFRELVAEVRRVSLDAYAHQDLPFERLVEELQPERDLSSTPLFRVMFILQNAPAAGGEMPGLSPDVLDAEATTAKFDLTLSLQEGEAGASGELEYGTDLFDPTTMVRLVAHFKRLLEGIVEDPERRLGELPWMTVPERHQLLVEWRGTGTEAPSDLCIRELFEAQVEARPDARAVVCGPTIVSYRELDERASRLAHHLRELGVAPEVVVGIAAERRPEVVVGLLGILKAGGVYLPLDPSHPEERLAFQLRDAGARVLLVCESAAERLPEHEARVVVLDGPRAAVGGKRTELVA
ncbi:MAG: amino acid adenylation domain-containing protein, partial [bacterium]|nr:amino acid adenylation domain-containing protein [bacterium]